MPGRTVHSNHLAFEPYERYGGPGPLPFQGNVYVDQTPPVWDAGIEVGSRLRINVGLYNWDAEHAIVHRLTLYAAGGTKVVEREVTLEP